MVLQKKVKPRPYYPPFQLNDIDGGGAHPPPSKGNKMDQNNRDQTDREQLCAFHRRSRYDLIQASQNEGWGPIFTFSPCDVRAAQKAGQMMARMHRGEQLRVRHARRARLHNRQCHIETDAVVVTEFPGREQRVLQIENGLVLRVDVYVEDDALAALEAALTRTPRP
jgi:hypothetical protein